jgi:AcrR family transcriptional regulator
MVNMLSNVRLSEDPRVIRTRSLIVTAFNELLHAKGFEQMTVGDIAAQATVNRATFYAHFDDKYSLFAYATRVQFREILHQHITINAPYSGEQLKQLIKSLYIFIHQLHASCARSFRSFEPMVSGEVVAEVVEVLKAWRLTKCDEMMNGNLVTSMVSWGLYGAIRDWILSQHPNLDESFTERLVVLSDPLLNSALTTS